MAVESKPRVLGVYQHHHFLRRSQLGTYSKRFLQLLMYKGNLQQVLQLGLWSMAFSMARKRCILLATHTKILLIGQTASYLIILCMFYHPHFQVGPYTLVVWLCTVYQAKFTGTKINQTGYLLDCRNHFRSPYCISSRIIIGAPSLVASQCPSDHNMSVIMY